MDYILNKFSKKIAKLIAYIGPVLFSNLCMFLLFLTIIISAFNSINIYAMLVENLMIFIVATFYFIQGSYHGVSITLSILDDVKNSDNS